MGDKMIEKVFDYFKEIAKIPHGSGNTKLISDYLADFAKKRNLEHYQDEVNNIIIIMNEADFIQEIMKQANLSEDQGGMVNEIFQNNFVGGDKSKNIIVDLIAEKLGVDKAQAETIYTIGAGLLAAGVLDKILGIFKRK